MPYGLSADVAALLQRGGISGDFQNGPNPPATKPTKTSVDDWLAKLSLRLDARIRGAGYDPATASVDGKELMEDAVCGFIAGRIERIYAGVVEGEPNDSGKDLQAPLLELFERLKSEPDVVAVELGLTAAATGASTALKSYFTDDADAQDEVLTPDNLFKVSGKT